MTRDDTRSVTRRFSVTGRVQGVFFRESTRREALKLGLTGHAINMADGSVDVLASGESEAIDALHDWLHQGPPMASVSGVQEIDAPTGEFDGFSVA